MLVSAGRECAGPDGLDWKNHWCYCLTTEFSDPWKGNF